MEPEGPLQCSQEPVTRPVLNQLNTAHTLVDQLPNTHFNIIYALIPTWSIPHACYIF
jgi:hypothetical protein